MEKGRLKKLIIPLVLEQLLAVSVGMADTFMVADGGEAAVSGVSLVDGLNLLVIQIMAAFAAGGVVIISQYIGQKNRADIKSACRHLEILINSFSILVMTVFLFFGRGILGLLFGQIEPDVMAAAVTYLMITAVSFVFWGICSSGAAILRCHEDTKTSMKVSVLMNLINVALNAVFVYIVGIGVMGVAIATLISRAIAGIVMKIILVRRNRAEADTEKTSGISFGMLKRILAMGIPSGIENGMFHVGKLALASVISTLGTTAIAANSIAYQVIEFPNIAGNTIGLALVVIAGQDIGARNKEAAVSDSKHLLKLAYIGDWMCKIAFFFLAPLIVSLFSLTPEAVDTAVLVLRCFSIASLPIWPLSFTMPNALRGAGDVRFTMIVSIISMWAGRVIVGYILITVFDLGILGVWIGMFVDWYIRGISFLIRFRSKKWLEKRAV
ncbi:MAG: MATE family efflux transporter [Lachnospiraceae bacterium]|nr:MATE family efflux transporter [Lachnospiraceae bacterium]